MILKALDHTRSAVSIWSQVKTYDKGEQLIVYIAVWVCLVSCHFYLCFNSSERWNCSILFHSILFHSIQCNSMAMLLQCYCNALAFKVPFFFGIFMVNKKINDKSECEHFYQLNRQFKAKSLVIHHLLYFS